MSVFFTLILDASLPAYYVINALKWNALASVSQGQSVPEERWSTHQTFERKAK